MDYGIIASKLEEEMPDLFLAGYSAYPYAIDFKKMRELIDAHNAKHGAHCFFMVDMAHIAGIVAAKLCQNPCDYADIVTSTTHKTLRGPRGGLIMTNREDLVKPIKSAVFPFAQGGPPEHIIASKAVNFLEDLQPSFADYMKQVLINTKASSDELARKGCVVSGTENHLFLLNVLASFGLTGLEAQNRLEEIGVTTNKNMIHGDTLKPNQTSGVRIGFAASTTRGCTREQAVEIADLIYDVLSDDAFDPAKYIAKVSSIVATWQNVMDLHQL